MSEALLEIQGVSKHFGGFAALTQVDLEVRQGERLGLIGPNGSGKTTLINCVSGLLRPDQGRIRFEGRDLARQPPYRRARAGISRSFQIPKPFTSMNVLDNLCVPLRFAAARHSSLAKLREEALETLTLFGMEHKASWPPTA